jgi:hypothetical protein
MKYLELREEVLKREPFFAEDLFFRENCRVRRYLLLQNSPAL